MCSDFVRVSDGDSSPRPPGPQPGLAGRTGPENSGRRDDSGRPCKPLGVYQASTAEHSPGLTRASFASTISATSRTFVCSGRRAAPPFARPSIELIHIRDCVGVFESHPGAIESRAKSGLSGCNQIIAVVTKLVTSRDGATWNPATHLTGPARLGSKLNTSRQLHSERKHFGPAPVRATRVFRSLVV